jgi:hypothetical protein
VNAGAGCANHPLEPARTRCASCSRRLCNTCWQHTADRQPWCALCIAHLETGARARWPLAITLVGIAAAAIAVGWRWEARHGGDHALLLWASFGVMVAGIAAFLVFRDDARPHGRAIAPREPDEEPAFDAEARVGHPYRSRLVRAAKVLAPPLSGLAATVVVLLCLALPAALLPVSLGLPRWIEAEIVIGCWWLVWATALSVLLYRGFRLSHDYVLRAPSSPIELSSSGAKGSGCRNLDAGAGCDPGCGALGEGFALVLVAAVAAVVALGAAWLLVELLLPAIFFLAYALVRGALARVANDEHRCEGSPLRAIGWGTLWATVYVAPLALVVWAFAAVGA